MTAAPKAISHGGGAVAAAGAGAAGAFCTRSAAKTGAADAANATTDKTTFFIFQIPSALTIRAGKDPRIRAVSAKITHAGEETSKNKGLAVAAFLGDSGHASHETVRL
jgi:hypothetical protein